MAKEIKIPPITPEAIIEKAREYLGTPWHHAARVKGVGVDCVGLLLCVAHDLGIPVEDDVNYTYQDEFERMIGHIKRYCVLLPEDAPIFAGDILVFRARGMTNHCGFANGNGGMIHAYRGSGVDCVVEHDMNENWLKRVACKYRYRGLAPSQV